MNPAAFIDKWRHVSLTERAASQQHFLDLCALVNHPTPAAADPTGDSFTFERGAAKHGGGDGWADVWKRGFFAFEYKGKHKNLDAAYDQLLKYRESLENPPLLVVCDLDRILIHTNFTATTKTLHSIALEDLGQPRNLEILRHLFHDPERLKPGTTSVAITQDAAARLARLAESLRLRDVPPADAAHFLVRVVFCLFAEDIGLLPDRIFTNVVEKTRTQPALFRDYLAQLFHAMATGGHFLLEPIRHFNGNLFSGDDVIALTAPEIESIHLASHLDWSAVDPSILGTLFERGLDPAKRTQLGAHYTSREDIETLVEPVVMAPLRREWQETKTIAASLLATGKKTAVPADSGKILTGPALKKARAEAERILQRFQEKLSHITVLDPACGSGNFLYVTLQKMKDLEKEIIVHSMDLGFSGSLPMVGPWQLYGLELSPYAYDLAQMTVWVGFLQWTRANGFAVSQNPVLRTMTNFQNRDAILDLRDAAQPKEAVWPQVDFIVGNPPFLGDKIMRSQLGDDYVSALRKFYEGRVPGGADLCCYWFERARTQ